MPPPPAGILPPWRRTARSASSKLNQLLGKVFADGFGEALRAVRFIGRDQKARAWTVPSNRGHTSGEKLGRFRENFFEPMPAGFITNGELNEIVRGVGSFFLQTFEIRIRVS